MSLKHALPQAGIAGLLFSLSLLGGTPASACLRMHTLGFEPGGSNVMEQTKIADFLQVAEYGGRQKIIVRVSGSDLELAERRVRVLADLLTAYGLAPTGIMLETNRSEQERAILIIYPQPRTAPADIAVVGSSPAGSAPRGCGG